MEKVIFDWLHAMNEFLKFCLVVWGILGYSANKRCSVKKVLLFTGAGLLLYIIWKPDRMLFALIYAFIFLFLFFDGTIKAKMEAYLVTEAAIGILEIFVWSILILVIPKIETINLSFLNIGLDVVWVLILLVLYRYRKFTYEYFITLSFPWFCIFVSILLGLGIMAGSIQYIMYVEVSRELKKLVLAVQSVVAILVVTGCIALVYNVVSKKHVLLLLDKEEEKYGLIKNFYEEKQKQNEEIQRFRHDMKKHMQIIGQLCDDIQTQKESVERLREYVNEYTDIYPVQERISTGHIVSDYFLSELVRQMSHNTQFKKKIHGRFPKDLPVTDVELSILLGNAINNATEELIRIEGPCFFRMEIENYKGNISIEIENTMAPAHFGKKTNSHGLGIKNMREIVRQNDGNIEIGEVNGMFKVSIFLGK